MVNGRPLLKTRLTELLDIEHPILLAGMGSFGECTPPPLVAAVSKAGGMGIIGGTGMSADMLREQIRAVRQLTDRPFGVDLLMPQSVADRDAESRSSLRAQVKRQFPRQWAFSRDLIARFGLAEDVEVGDDATATTPEQALELADVVFEEKVPLLACAFGVPSWVVPRARQQGMKVLGLVGNVDHARKQAEAGVDVLVATGTEAGGHTGRIGTLPLVPQVVDRVAPIPVVAAGGIGNGRQLAAVLALGAAGIWVGTAFLLSSECGIKREEKQIIIDGRSEEFGLHRIYTGKPMRGFTNDIIRAWETEGLPPLPVPFQKILLDDLRYAARRVGRFDLDANPAGQVSGMLTGIRPAAEIVESFVDEAVAAIRSLQLG